MVDTCSLLTTQPGDLAAVTTKDGSSLDFNQAQVLCGDGDGSFRGTDRADVLMFVFPKSIQYRVSFEVALLPLKEEYRLTTFATWQDLTEDIAVVCDYEGYPFFTKSNAKGVVSDLFIPESLVSLEFSANSTKTSGFIVGVADRLPQHGKKVDEPLVGEGFAISAALCRIRPWRTMEAQTRWPGSEGALVVSYKVYITNSWGNLHPEMYAELLFLAVLFVPKLLLTVWFFYQTRIFREHVLSQQRLFFYTSLSSWVANSMIMFYLVWANTQAGHEICCPPNSTTVFFLAIKMVSNMMFYSLLLATAKGWGVVNPKMDPADVRKIVAFFLFSLLIYGFSHTIRPNIALAWVTIFSETFIWVWIFWCLRQTRRDLEASGRLDRTAKLDMYLKLRKLLVRSLMLVVLIIVVLIIAVIAVFNSNGTLIIPFIPPTLAWDCALLVMMIGFGWIWRPSPATAQFAYSFSRQEESSLGDDDPMASFGLERL